MRRFVEAHATCSHCETAKRGMKSSFKILIGGWGGRHGKQMNSPLKILIGGGERFRNRQAPVTVESRGAVQHSLGADWTLCVRGPNTNMVLGRGIRMEC